MKLCVFDHRSSGLCFFAHSSGREIFLNRFFSEQTAIWHKDCFQSPSYRRTNPRLHVSPEPAPAPQGRFLRLYDTTINPIQP